jgi:histidine kinase
MLIRNKLLTSYIAMIIIPIVLLVLTLTSIGAFLEGLNRNERTHGKIGLFFTITDNNDGLFSKIIEEVKVNPGVTNSQKSLADLAEKINLRSNKAGLIVRKGEKIFYATKGYDRREFYQILPQYSGYSNQSDTYEIGENVYTLKIYGFLFPDNIPGMIYLISDVSKTVKTMFSFLIIIPVALLLSIAVTNGLLTLIVSRSILKPLHLLKEAAQRISSGDLNFKIIPSSRDELGELAVAFEQMRRRLQESLNTQLEYEKNRKELISGITHDLKTPITAIKGYIEGIIDGVANSPQKVDKYIRTIRTKANHLDRMIDDLFLFSKLDLGKLPFNFETVNLKQFLIDILEELNFDLSQKGIRLISSINCKGPVLAKADRDKLRRVLVNIIENSVKYMDDSKPTKEIAVNLEQKDDRTVSIMIKDNGLGINKENLPFIFERFYRTDQDRNSETGGSGLGLAIVKLIIEEHQGIIWAESKLGQGTTIGFCLKRLVQS